MLRGMPASNPARARRAEVATFTAPVGGWISNRALAVPSGADVPQGATRLDNFFPTATGAVLRRGKRSYAQLGGGETAVTSLFGYVDGVNERLFGAIGTTIYDITTVQYPENISLMVDDGDLLETDDGDTLGENSTEGLEVYENTTAGDWVTVQFGTTGGTYLIGVNGASPGFIFDGTDFFPYGDTDVIKLSYNAEVTEFVDGETITGATSGATGDVYKVVPSLTPGEGTLWLINVTGTFQNAETIDGDMGGDAEVNGAPSIASVAITFKSPEGDSLTTADLAFVWIYKESLYFAEKNSLRGWYLPPDSVGGELKPFPLNGLLDRGGSLLWGQSWSLASSDSGGLSAQNVFCTTEGECAVFQGLSPDDASWQMVGVYRIGKPLGKHGFIRAGGDIVIATDIGDIALSKAVQVDFAALAPSAVSYPIEVAWNEAVAQRGRDWRCELWPEGQMAIVIPPRTGSAAPVWFVANASTGAWAPFTNWDATCVLAWNGRLFYGSTNGMIYEAMVGGTDSGLPYTGVYVPLYSDLGKPTAYKVARMARVETRSAAAVSEKVSCLADFDANLPSPPGASIVPVGNEWDNATWDVSIWDTDSKAVVTRRRHSVGARGYRLSPVYQVTSGAAIPLDVELITLDMTYESGDAFT